MSYDDLQSHLVDMCVLCDFFMYCSAETLENGQRYTSSVGYGDASPTSSWKLGAFVLPLILHFRGFRS